MRCNLYVNISKKIVLGCLKFQTFQAVSDKWFWWNGAHIAIWLLQFWRAKAPLVCGATQMWTKSGFSTRVKQACVQPRQNGQKLLLNWKGGALNTLFWWCKSCNYGSWEGHSLCSFWRIFIVWWKWYKYMFNTAKYAQQTCLLISSIVAYT